MKVTLGGDRIGSGNKEKVYLHNYGRSTHNLSENYQTSAGVGLLYPCLCKQALRGDKFNYDISAGVRTIPTRGAMFGTFKLQIDYYFCPARLYVGILHNNPIDIGLQMKNVMFPSATITFNNAAGSPNLYRRMPTNPSSLLHYLGFSGLGCSKNAGVHRRRINAIPILAYYDIFKNYYSNKQEPMAYVCHYDPNGSTGVVDWNHFWDDNNQTEINITKVGNEKQGFVADLDSNLSGRSFTFEGVNLDIHNIKATVYFIGHEGETPTETNISIKEGNDKHYWQYSVNQNGVNVYVEDSLINALYFFVETKTGTLVSDTYLQPFELKNIDRMRAALLSNHELGVSYNIALLNKFPYKAIVDQTNPANPNENLNSHPLQGLMIKTYQADIFNVWLATEYIDGLNGIAEITKVAVEGGGFKIDALNFSEKMYNLLNRIATAGNTYEDYQNVVWEDLPKRHLESPLYLGGVSQEIIFEEIVATNVASANDQYSEECGLGSIGSRGISRHRKGGKIRFKCDEAGYIIGIMSITPRITQCQYNEFYFTDIMSVDDLHKPALDQIGFQDLIGERMAYFDTKYTNTTEFERHTIGKIPAWLEYMTSFDRTHGDFANGSNGDFMVLNRNYIFNEELGCIEDATTYIDPQKFNNIFMYNARDAQNFWVQIVHQNKTRRKMSAKLIPNI